MELKIHLVVITSILAFALIAAAGIIPATFVNVLAQGEGGANQTMQNAGQSTNQTMQGAGQSANQTGEAIKQNVSDIVSNISKEAKSKGSNITKEVAKDVAANIGKQLQDLAK